MLRRLDERDGFSAARNLDRRCNAARGRAEYTDIGFRDFLRRLFFRRFFFGKSAALKKQNKREKNWGERFHGYLPIAIDEHGFYEAKSATKRRTSCFSIHSSNKSI